MKIRVNGAEMVIPEAATIDHLLDLLEFKGQGRFAVEINGEIIARSQYMHHRLAADDRVEVVRAIGGG
ncbi:MAG: sulfur carrier protein ThiS [Gammaproteobacteria bacterium]